MFVYSFELGTFRSETVDLAQAFEMGKPPFHPAGKSWAQFCIDNNWTSEDVQRFIEIAERQEQRLKKLSSQGKILSRIHS